MFFEDELLLLLSNLISLFPLIMKLLVLISVFFSLIFSDDNNFLYSFFLIRIIDSELIITRITALLGFVFFVICLVSMFI